MKQTMRLLLVFSAIIVFHGCSAQMENTRKKNLKDQTVSDMYAILTDSQLGELKNSYDDKDVNEFVSSYWNECDPTPGTNENELKEEFEKRLNYANVHFPDKKGWGRSDMKRIYLQYGPPDDIERNDWADIPLSSGKRIKSLEIWVYFEPANKSFFPTKLSNGPEGIKKFLFADYHGARFYKLVYSSEDMQDIDAVFNKSSADY